MSRDDIIVAPRAGAWIETPEAGCRTAQREVAPRAGAWIETSDQLQRIAILSSVAPRAGAWIETTCR